MKFSKTKFAAAMGLAALLATASLRAAEADAETQSQDQIIEELRTMLGNTVAQLNDTKSRLDNGVNFGVNSDLRYDFQKWSAVNAQSAAGYAANGRNYVASSATDIAPNGVAGMYAKRIEVEFKAKTASWAQWHLQFDFAGLKLEDLGVELNELPFLPMMDSSSWNWGMKIGQFRQPFGIEQQTGSSSIAFSERAMMYGGANPVGGSKLVAERVMGVHVWHEKSFGPIGYKMQFAVANDSGDQNPGTGSLGGTQFLNTTATAFNLKDYPFTGQRTDQDPGEFGRLGIDLNFMPKIAKLNVGGSAIHNSTNKTFYATGVDGSQMGEQNVYGFDSTLAMDSLNWKVWGEWLASNNSVGANSSVANSGPASKGINSFALTRSEAWYVTSCMQPLKFFMKDAPALDLNIRFDNFVANVDNQNTPAAAAKPYAATSAQALSYGLKWSYVGKNYTSLNYTVYGFNGDFGALAGTELFVAQQQFNF